MMSFGRLLASCLRQRHLSQRAFAGSAHCVPSYVSRLVRGERAAPDEPVVRLWAELLELKGEDRERFLLAADLSRTPHRVLVYIAHLRAASNTTNYG